MDFNLIKSNDRILPILKAIPFNIVLMAMFIFHFTLTRGANYMVLERIIGFYYAPENAVIIDFIRAFLLNIATVSWSYCFFVRYRQEKYFYKYRKNNEIKDKAYKIKVYSGNGTLLYETYDISSKLTIKNDVGEFSDFSKTISTYNATYVVEECDFDYSAMKYYVDKRYNFACITTYTLLARYFLDILKYPQSWQTFFDGVKPEIMNNLIVGIICAVVLTCIACFYKYIADKLPKSLRLF